MAGSPLIITNEIQEQFVDLRARASRNPVDVLTLLERIKTPDGKRKHRRQMTAQTVVIPGTLNFYITFSIETGHPQGVCRHLSMSVSHAHRVPHPVAVWFVAEMLGFQGGLDLCASWSEDLEDGGKAINIVQPISIAPVSKDRAAAT